MAASGVFVSSIIGKFIATTAAFSSLTTWSISSITAVAVSNDTAGASSSVFATFVVIISSSFSAATDMPIVSTSLLLPLLTKLNSGYPQLQSASIVIATLSSGRRINLLSPHSQSILPSPLSTTSLKSC